MIQESYQDALKTALEEHVSARRRLRAKAEDGRLKLEILKDEANLLGLYPDTGQRQGSNELVIRVRYGDDGTDD